MPTKREVIRTACMADTLFATRYFFYQQYGHPFNVGDHHKLIAEKLDRVYAGKCKRLIINVPPRYSKTEMAVKTFIAKGFAINPKAKFIHLSYSGTLALDNSKETKEIVASEWYADLFPHVKIRKDAKAKQKRKRKPSTPSALMNGKRKSEPKVDDKSSQNGKLSTPSVASLFTQRRNGNCDPQRVQNDIKSFF